MRPLTLLAAAALLTAALALPGAARGADHGGPVPTITAERLSGTPNVAIVDVRRPQHWDASHDQIAGAWRGAPDEVERWSRSLSPAARIVLYCDCPGSATSAAVARELARLGFRNVHVLEGGWSRWSAAGFPVERRRL